MSFQHQFSPNECPTFPWVKGWSHGTAHTLPTPPANGVPQATCTSAWLTTLSEKCFTYEYHFIYYERYHFKIAKGRDAQSKVWSRDGVHSFHALSRWATFPAHQCIHQLGSSQILVAQSSYNSISRPNFPQEVRGGATSAQSL